jgi:hypothetical protein
MGTLFARSCILFYLPHQHGFEHFDSLAKGVQGGEMHQMLEW